MIAKLPLYSQVKENILSDIKNGKLVSGDSLPSHRDLIRRYGMSHMTVRRAIDELVIEGVLYTIPGKGVYVAEQKQEAESGALVSFSEDIARRGMKPGSKLLEAKTISAPQLFAATLGVELGIPLLHIVRLRLADNQPMAIQNTYIPYHLVPHLLEYDLERESLFQLFTQKYGFVLSDSQIAVEAALATESEAQLLDLRLPAALLITEQTTFLSTGDAVEFTRSAYHGEKYRRRL